MQTSKVFIADTTDGARLIRASNIREARKFAIDTYFKGIRKASIDDVCDATNADGSRVVVEDAGKIELQGAGEAQEQQG